MANRFLYLVRHGEAIDDGALSEAGERQARLTGERLRGVPFAAIHHSPLPRAARTAALISAHHPDVPVHASELVGDYLPSVPDAVPPVYKEFLAQFSAAERNSGPPLAAAALARHARPVDADRHELIVTHNFLIAWFVRDALDAPDARWLGLNQGNCGVTVIRYRADRPAQLLVHNDLGHLPPELRWTGFPPELRV